MKIPNTNLPDIYSACKLVWEVELSLNEAANKLTVECGMNNTSAKIYISVFASLMQGKAFKRTLNTYSVEYLIKGIKLDYGHASFIQALKALKAHIIYYESCHPGQMNRLRELHQKYINQNPNTPHMNRIISRPASLVKQGELILYATSLKVSDLLLPKFYSVEKLDPDDPGDKGYQRLLNKARAKKLADYIVNGQETKDAFLPTSIFMATDKNIVYNTDNNTIEINIDDVGPFSVVDGQHRVEGLRMAAEKDARVLNFEVPVNIAINLSKIAQMCHFLIVNTTQKSVEKGVEQRIYARLTKALEVEDIPNLPKWISNSIQKGEDEKALQFVDYLNNEKDSPWYGRIEMANDENKDATVNQKSFVKSIKRYVLVANNPLTIYPSDKQHKIFLNFWKAVTNIIGTEEPTVLFKYNGVELFCKFCVPFFNKLINIGDFKVTTMEPLLEQTFDNLEGDYAGVGHTAFWVKGGKASFLNSGALNVINTELVKSLHQSNLEKEIDL